jgi:NADPH-dependent 2,4-dienoyl-CoA reductase/sulfur reductase-like enzyme
MTSPSAHPADVLNNFRVPGRPLYLIGTFERGVTVYSQQIRAFNLIWALVEHNILECNLQAGPEDAKRVSVAIIGGGFAGLSAAAALLKKGVRAEIAIF